MKKKIALVCIAKDEDDYLQEWIDYHLKLGFDDIHIFQNDWVFKNVIPNKNVFFHEWNVPTIKNGAPIWERNRQAMCYTHFARKYYQEYEWAAFFDVDEFLVLKDYTDVKPFIENYKNHDCLIINWALFGDNGHKTFDINNSSVIKRFTKRWNRPHTEGYYCFKSICKLHENMVHNVHWNDGYWIDTNFNIGNENKNYNVCYDKAQLNHYFTKTYPEWLRKISKSRCDDEPLPKEIFDLANHNDVDDFHALNFFKN